MAAAGARLNAPAERPAAPLLELRGLAFGYGPQPLLGGVDLCITAGERVALLGANGAGKSTLLHLIVGLLPAAAGEVRAGGHVCRSEADFRALRARVGLVFQHSDDQLFCPTVLDDVAFGPLNLGLPPERAAAVAERTLGALGLDGFGARITHRLSGGEKRLVALATVLAMEPELLLLDEPTSGLDGSSRARLLEHLAALPQAMLVVSHDPAVLEHLTTRAVLLRDGRLVGAALHRHRHEHAHLHLHPLDRPAGHDHGHGSPDLGAPAGGDQSIGAQACDER